MSLTRRLAAGLPVAGVTAFAALALTGAPAAATGDEAAARAINPAVMTTPCANGERDEDCGGYGNADDVPNDNATTTTAPTRGNGGYGSVSPTPSKPTPTASVDTVPPGGESPETSPPVSPSPSRSTSGGGVSAGGTLPLTGAPAGLTITVGALLIAGGAGAVYASRRRRA
jgi:LPXTG-motif cell wall-anchored protein